MDPPHHDRDKVLAVARQLLPAWPARAGCRIEYLPGGYSNRNYRLDVDGARYALRIVQGAKPRDGEQRYLEGEVSLLTVKGPSLGTVSSDTSPSPPRQTSSATMRRPVIC